jgi:predicted PurR-regulated permease PerM
MVRMAQESVRRWVLLLLVILISAVFIAMIRPFLVTLLLAAIFSGMAHPLYSRLCRAFRGRRGAASAATLAIIVLVVVLPLSGLLAMVAAQALRITETVRPLIADLIANPGETAERLQDLPGFETIAPYREEILTKLGQLVETIGTFVFHGLSQMTRGTILFFFHFFLLLYTMFFFLMSGRSILEKILYYIPLPDEDEERMVERFVSVTRATLKGTVIIGIVQGAMAGAAFAVAGIEGAVFWGAVMAVLSIIPGIGSGLVWGPAAVYLLITGKTITAIALAVYCALVVGSIDNFLRPRLVGKDVKMHDLFILFGTLGGILLFGVVGFILGPIIAALFVTVWDIYGVVFRDLLPRVGWLRGEKAE